MRDNHAIDQSSVKLTIDGGEVERLGFNDDDNATPMSIFFLFDRAITPLGNRFEPIDLGPDGPKTVTLITQDVAQNMSTVRQSVFVDTAPPRISNFQIVPADANSGVRQANGVTMVSGRINISAVIEDSVGINAAQVLASGINTLNEDSTGMTRVTVEFRGYDTSNLPTTDDPNNPAFISVFSTDLAENASVVRVRVIRVPR